MSWLPIESAPKDGTFFIAIEGTRMEVVNEPPGCMLGKWTRGKHGWCGAFVSIAPTHWHHLPEPPADDRWELTEAGRALRGGK